MLRPFTCEDANKLPLSNDFLDEIIAWRLLLATYEKRQEAESFRLKRKELDVACLSMSKNIAKLNSMLRSALDASSFGTSTGSNPCSSSR